MQKTTDDLVKDNAPSIDEWKAKHRTVKVIVANSKYNGKQPYIIGKPTGIMLDAIAKYDNEGKTHKINELLINSCVLAGNKDLFADDVDLKNAVLLKVTDLLERLEVEEKEL